MVMWRKMQALGHQLQNRRDGPIRVYRRLEELCELQILAIITQSANEKVDSPKIIGPKQGC